MKQVLDRFLEYIAVDTTSDENSSTYPSTPAQLVLGRRLAEECERLGLSEVMQDEHGYVTATIPAKLPADMPADSGTVPVIGLVAHMDTSSAVSGAEIKARLVDYKGGDIVLNEEKNIVMKQEEFPCLKECEGRTLVVTDGTTLLGADDKAGIAEILTLAERLMAPDAPFHGTIRIAFTPDEEISGGTKYFDVKAFGADVAYTIDGGPVGELEYENFNAATATIEITGRSIHPGAAKGKMINAAVVGCEFQAMLPGTEQPAFTEGYQGFYHLLSIQGGVEQCRMRIAIREHDSRRFQAQKEQLQSIAETLNYRWGEGTVQVSIKDQYYNMCSIIENHMELVEHAVDAFRSQGVEPKIQPVRGGTDGARLSFAGLPCPNLSTGGYNFHARYEFIPVDAMETMVEVLLKLVSGFVEEKEDV